MVPAGRAVLALGLAEKLGRVCWGCSVQGLQPSYPGQLRKKAFQEMHF